MVNLSFKGSRPSASSGASEVFHHVPSFGASLEGIGDSFR
jgi:hypothetical protein